MVDEKKLKDILMSYFSIGDSYTFNLTRVKEGSELSVDDFCEFEESDVDDIVKYVLKHLKNDNKYCTDTNKGDRLGEIWVDREDRALVRRMREKRVGEVNYTTSGVRMEIVAYRGVNDVDVLFENGFIATNRKYSWFKRGTIRKIPENNSKRVHSRNLANVRLGEVGISKNGMQMSIIAYRSATDIDVQFEDGCIFKNLNYADFKEGNISSRPERVGETSISNNGMQMKIIAYRNANDIDVQFEDGTIRKNKQYRKFKEGGISNVSRDTLRILRLGETNTSTSGEVMRIIEYRNCQDIDVQFSDGTIIKNRCYSDFKRGSISKVSIKDIRTSRLGETNTSTSGEVMKIIEYRNYQDIDIEFEDGTIVKNRAYNSFKRGTIRKDNK